MFKNVKTWQRGDYSAIRDLSKVVVHAGIALNALTDEDANIPVKAALLTGLQKLLAPRRLTASGKEAK